MAQEAENRGVSSPPERKEERMPTRVDEAGARIWLNLLELPWEEARLEVRTEMARLGVSQDDLAYKLRRNGYKASANTVKGWLRGEAAPRYDGVREIVLVLARVSAGDSPKASHVSQPQLPYVFGSGSRREHDLDSVPKNPARQGVAA